MYFDMILTNCLTYPARVINIARGNILNCVMQILLNQAILLIDSEEHAHRRRNWPFHWGPGD